MNIACKKFLRIADNWRGVRENNGSQFDETKNGARTPILGDPKKRRGLLEASLEEELR